MDEAAVTGTTGALVVLITLIDIISTRLCATPALSDGGSLATLRHRVSTVD